MEQILRSVGSRKSPITGESFPALTPVYKEKKEGMGLDPVPDLEQSGTMLDELDFEVTRDGIKIGVFGEAALRADGHNNLSGESRLPERRFLPAEGQGFTPAIEREVERIIADFAGEDEEVPDEELEEVESSSGLYDVLIPVFGLGSRSETRLAVLRSPKWYERLASMGLLKWL